MSRGFVHHFDVLAASPDEPIADSEGRWQADTVTQHVRGRLGTDAEMLRNPATPENVDLVALVPADTNVTAPTTVVVPPGLERWAAAGTYNVAQITRLQFHIRLGLVRQRAAQV